VVLFGFEGIYLFRIGVMICEFIIFFCFCLICTKVSDFVSGVFWNILWVFFFVLSFLFMVSFHCGRGFWWNCLVYLVGISGDLKF